MFSEMMENEDDAANKLIASSTNATLLTDLKEETKNLYKGRVFLGRYIERRLVDKVGYRDVVLLSDAEVKLRNELLKTLSSLRVWLRTWIGISEPVDLGFNSGVCIWTEIDYEPFGPMWLQIKTVAFRANEVIVKVKCLRHITEEFLELEPILTRRSKPAENTQETNELDFNMIIKTIFSLRTLIDVLTFIVAFIGLICTGGVEFVYFLGNFVLAFMREITNFINNATPGFLGLLNFFSKIVGGFYILLAMLFRQNAPPPLPNRRMIKYNTVNHDNTFNGQFD